MAESRSLKNARWWVEVWERTALQYRRNSRLDEEIACKEAAETLRRRLAAMSGKRPEEVKYG